MAYKYPDYRQPFNGSSGAQTSASQQNAFQQKTGRPSGGSGYDALSNTMSQWRDLMHNAPKTNQRPPSGVEYYGTGSSLQPGGANGNTGVVPPSMMYPVVGPLPASGAGTGNSYGSGGAGYRPVIGPAPNAPAAIDHYGPSHSGGGSAMYPIVGPAPNVPPAMNHYGGGAQYSGGTADYIQPMVNPNLGHDPNAGPVIPRPILDMLRRRQDTDPETGLPRGGTTPVATTPVATTPTPSHTIDTTPNPAPVPRTRGVTHPVDNPTTTGETDYQSLADRYSQTPGYEYLKTRPQLIKYYQQWAYDPNVSDQERTRRQGTHITKWLSDNGYNKAFGGWGPNGVPGGTASRGNAARDAEAAASSSSASSSTTPVPPANGGPQGGGSGESDYMSKLEGMLRSAYARKMEDNTRALRGQAALTNMQDSGGFASAMADMAGRNAAEESGALSNMLFTGEENERERALKRLLGQMGLEGTKYSADSASSAAASSAAAQLQAALAGIDQRDRGDQLNYNLGILGINRDIYGMDQGNLIRLLQMMGGLGPEAFTSGLFNNFGGFGNNGSNYYIR